MIDLVLRILGLRRAGRGEGSGSDEPPFLAGLALGALVGAAIAGSTVWRRLHGRGAHDDEG